MKRNHRRSKRGPSRSINNNSVFRSSRQKVARLSGCDFYGSFGASFPSGSATPNAGIINNLKQVGSLNTTGIDGAWAPVTPGTLGTRCAHLGDNYAMYKVRCLRYTYRPNQSGTNTSVSAVYSNASGVYQSTPCWDAVIAWCGDPNFLGNVFTPSEALCLSNAKIVDMSKPWTLVVKPPRKFLYQPTPVNSTGIADSPGDLRTEMCGLLIGLWSNAGAGAFPIQRTGSLTNTLEVDTGQVYVDWIIDFQVPLDPDIVEPGPSRPTAVLINKFIQKRNVRNTMTDGSTTLAVVNQRANAFAPLIASSKKSEESKSQDSAIRDSATREIGRGDPYRDSASTPSLPSSSSTTPSRWF